MQQTLKPEFDSFERNIEIKITECDCIEIRGITVKNIGNKNLKIYIILRRVEMRTKMGKVLIFQKIRS